MNTNHARSWKQSYQYAPQREPQKVKVKVQKKNWLTKGEKVLYSVVSACIIATGIFVVSYSSSADTINRDVQKIEAKVRHQEMKNESLAYKKKEYSRPERITKIAREKGLKIQNADVKQANALEK